jgi:N-acetylglucosaminyldiphosphoundecaprenol N-acetyl-beta-D-mannosaminyltransferase
MARVNLHGIPVDSVDDETVVLQAMLDRLGTGQPFLLSFVNPAAWAIHRREADYVGILRNFDLVLPDGIGVAWALRRLDNPKAGRFSFDASSLYLALFAALDSRRASVFVTGAGPGVAERAVERMRGEFPNIDYRGCCDGYVERERLRQTIKAADADVVLCGMGVPHQERFLLTLRDAGFGGIMISCGGFVDQLAAAQRYYPAWIDKLELRWAWRIYQEPRRLWRRYFVDYWPFLFATVPTVLRRQLLGTPIRLPLEERAGTLS